MTSQPSAFSITTHVLNEGARLEEFPVARGAVFMAHAGVTALPHRVASAIVDHTMASCENHQEFGSVLEHLNTVRVSAAAFIGAPPDEIALIGPTSLGLSLVAHGIAWRQGDEILCYKDDYPANVYPWMDAERRGAAVRFLEARTPGRITLEDVAAGLSRRTRLVALASCHFLTGWRLPVEEIGAMVRSRGALFCLDAIQTLGAFPTTVEHVDFLSADSHKWLLGPCTAGIFWARRERFEDLHPTLVGAWNAIAPDFIAQDRVAFHDSARRYEPGVLNIGPLLGMGAAIDLITQAGLDHVSRRICGLREALAEGLTQRGFQVAGPPPGHELQSGILTVTHASRHLPRLFSALEQQRIILSLRNDRAGREYIRFSPHFYNTQEEIVQVLSAIDASPE